MSALHTACYSLDNNPQCLLICRWAGAEDLNARLLVLAGGWGGGDDTPDLLACATDAPLQKVGGSSLAVHHC